LQNCQNVTSLIGIYLSAKPSNNLGSNGFKSSNLENSTISSTNEVIDASTLTSELREFQKTLQYAIANNQLQEILESLYSGLSAEPPVYVIPNDVSSSIISVGGNKEDDTNNDDNGGDNSSGDNASNTDGNVETPSNTTENKDDENNSQTGQGDKEPNGNNSTENGDNSGGEGSFPPQDDHDPVTGTEDTNDDDDDNNHGTGQGDNDTNGNNSDNNENDEEGTENTQSGTGGGEENTVAPESGNAGNATVTGTDDIKHDESNIENDQSHNVTVGNNSTNSENEGDGDGEDGTENVPTGNGNDKESTEVPTGKDSTVAPESAESGNEPIIGGDNNGNSTSTGNSTSGGTDSEGGSSSGAWLPNPSDNSAATSVGGGTLPIIDDNSLNANTSKTVLSMTGIVGIVIFALVAVMVVISLVYVRRRSNNNRNAGERSRRSGSSNKHKGKKSKSLVASVDEDDMISCDSSKKSSLGRFLYAGVSVDPMSPSSLSRRSTDHSRGTVPTVTSSISENTDASVTSSVADCGRGAESWRNEEVLIPMNTTRGLLSLDRVNEENGSEDEEDECDPFYGSAERSDLHSANISNSEHEAQAKNRIGTMFDDEEVCYSDASESPGWSTNSSPSTPESPLKAMAARSLAALRGNRGNRNRRIQKSKQDLEDVLSAGIVRDKELEDDIKEAERAALSEAYHDADDESSPMKKIERGTSSMYLSGSASADGSQASALSDLRPLNALDEAIMKGDWAAVSMISKDPTLFGICEMKH
jgi:hypothetical protein